MPFIITKVTDALSFTIIGDSVMVWHAHYTVSHGEGHTVLKSYTFGIWKSLKKKKDIFNWSMFHLLEIIHKFHYLVLALERKLCVTSIMYDFTWDRWLQLCEGHILPTCLSEDVFSHRQCQQIMR